MKIDNYITNSFLQLKNEADIPEDIHERSSVFRFAHYLANMIENDSLFNGYKVDTEYNRYNNDIKKNSDGNLIIPDLIIHKRCTKDNLCIIEFKKNCDDLDDKKRLIDMKNNPNYGYKHLFFINLSSSIEKYVNDEWVTIYEI